jgi:hypothetical protein
MLTFKEDTHQYFVDGKEVPGVSHVMKTLGLSKDYTGTDDFYRDRGTAVHKAAELYLTERLDESSLDPEIIPFFEGFKRFWEAHRHPLPYVEHMLYSESLGFAGSIDLVTDTIWDLKCSKSPDVAAEVQGALYQYLWEENFKQKLPFRVVRLPWESEKDTLSYEPTDENLAPATMILYRWHCKAHPRKNKL